MPFNYALVAHMWEHRKGRAMKRYQVIVGNIGQVYNGNNKREALRTYKQYVRQSIERSSMWTQGEPVTMFSNGEITAEYFGKDGEWL